MINKILIQTKIELITATLKRTDEHFNSSLAIKVLLVK